MAPALYRAPHHCPTAGSSSLAPVTCEVSQVLLAGGHVFFPGDISFSPLDSAQNELNNLDGPKIPIKKSTARLRSNQCFCGTDIGLGLILQI